MPLYAYRCDEGHDEEHIESFSSEKKRTCETCGGASKRILAAGSFHLKGGGWYADGYSSSKSKGSS